MIIFRIFAGLGDQLFQTIFAKYLESVTGHPIYLDTLWLDKRRDRAFAVRKARSPGEALPDQAIPILYAPKVFPKLQLSYYSETMSSSEYEGLLSEYDGEQSAEANLYRKHGLDFTLITFPANGDNYIGEKILIPSLQHLKTDWKALIDDALTKHKNILIQMHATFPDYYMRLKGIRGDDWIESEFEPVGIVDELNLFYLKLIEDSDSIGIHIRRGGMYIYARNMMAPDSFYKTAVKKLVKEVPNAKFFVFSDELNWCKEHINEIGLAEFVDRTVFVESNGYDENGEYVNDYIDMLLLAKCKHIIAGHTSYSYIARTISKNQENRRDIMWVDMVNVPSKTHARYTPRLWSVFLKYLPFVFIRGLAHLKNVNKKQAVLLNFLVRK